MFTLTRVPVRALLIVTMLFGFVAALLPSSPAHAADATITLSATEVEQDATLTVEYTVPTAGAKNWVAIYRVSDGTPDGTPGSRDWVYAPQTSGSHTFTLAADDYPAGDYIVYFLANDGYEPLADPVPFTVLPGKTSLNSLVDHVDGRSGRVGDQYEMRVAGLFTTNSEDAPLLSIEAGPSWLRAEDGYLRGTPDSTGRQNVTVTATLGDLAARMTITLPIVGASEKVGDDIRVVSYNTWIGGANVSGSLAKQLRAFLGQNADVVTLQEARAEPTQALADALGWYSFFDGADRAVISRYPILETDTSSASGGVLLSIDEKFDRRVWVWSAHLGYTLYGPYYAQEGKSVDYILGQENVQRGPQIRENLTKLASIETDYPNVPIVFTGDLNTPSHLDWTAATADRHNGLVVPWPVSTELQDAGYVDTFRAIHPDPVTDPGYSWTPIDASEPQDRIDFIYTKGDRLAATDSVVFTSADLADWATDHAAVATGLRWSDAATPPGPGTSLPADPDAAQPAGADTGTTPSDAGTRTALANTGTAPTPGILGAVIALLAGAGFVLAIRMRRRALSE